MFENVTFGEPVNLTWLFLIIGGMCFTAGVWVGSIEAPQMREHFREFDDDL